jgi:hypothetical protein
MASIPKVPVHYCFGHFDGNHALPVVILVAYCFDLAGYSIELLPDQDIPFRKERLSRCILLFALGRYYLFFLPCFCNDVQGFYYSYYFHRRKRIK